MMTSDRTNPAGRGRAAVLLEVIFALVLFFSAAGVVVGTLHSSVGALSRMRVSARAADLAVTLLSKLQLAEGPLQDQGPEPYEDEALKDWSFQVVTSDVDNVNLDAPVTRVVVVITHTITGYTHRLVQFFAGEDEPAPAAERPRRGRGQGS